MSEYIDYTTIARLLRDAEVPGDRVQFLIRMLAMPNQALVECVKLWVTDAAIESARLSAEQLTILQSALGNPSECP
jgi:hypothetical protein